MVFFSSDDRATKVFLRRHDAPEEHMESVFQSEVSAYKLVSDCENLRNLIPIFYGCVSVQKITNATGADISNRFYLHRAYQMQRVNGDFVKLGTLAFEVQKPLMESFRSLGVHHTRDASVIVENNIVSSIIDFATQEFVLEHQPL